MAMIMVVVVVVLVMVLVVLCPRSRLVSDLGPPPGAAQRMKRREPPLKGKTINLQVKV